MRRIRPTSKHPKGEVKPVAITLLRRRLTLLISLILVGVYAFLRLPPGQDLLRLIVERQLSDVVGSNVDISRLRTNLWDEISVHDVHWDSSHGPVHTLSLDSLRIRWTGGPPWPSRPAAINVHGLDLQLPAPAAPPAPASAIDDSANTDEGGEDSDLRRWIPDLTSVEGLRITVGDSSLVVAQLSGVLSAHRSVEDEMPAASTRIDFATDGATLRLPYGSRHWDTDIVGDFLVGSLNAGFGRFLAKPIRREQICAAIVDLLDVALEPLPETAVAIEESSHHGVVTVPATRLQELRLAAGSHNMTHLRKALEQLDDTDAG